MTTDTTKAVDLALVIEEAIVSGELEPGTVLRQEQFSERFHLLETILEQVGAEPRGWRGRSARSAR